MAIVIDSHGIDTSGGRTGLSSTTVSVTLASSATLIVFVELTAGGQTTSSVTHNGTAMTLLDSSTGLGSLKMYGLKNPTSGTHDIVVTFSGSLSGGQTEQVFWASFTGAHQTNPFITTTNTDNRILSIVTTRDNSMIVDAILSDASVTANGAQTSLNTDSFGNFGGQSYRLTTTAGSYNMSWSVSSGPDTGKSHVAVAIAPPTTDSVLTASTGAFVLTGVSNIMSVIHRLIAETGVFILSGQQAFSLRGIWTIVSKHTSSFANKVKSTSVFSNLSKHTSSWLDQDKH